MTCIKLKPEKLALTSIKRYLNSPINGLWYEIMIRDNTFSSSEARASTLYHITLAISQFMNHQMNSEGMQELKNLANIYMILVHIDGMIKIKK